MRQLFWIIAAPQPCQNFAENVWNWSRESEEKVSGSLDHEKLPARPALQPGALGQLRGKPTVAAQGPPRRTHPEAGGEQLRAQTK